MADFEALARSFGGVAGAYDRARPQYPAEAIDTAAAEFGLGSGSTVLDLAAGTGKLTRSLAERFDNVIAVEPSPAMLALVRSGLPAVDAATAARRRSRPLTGKPAPSLSPMPSTGSPTTLPCARSRACLGPTEASP
ncbi:hypothetical protein BH10ACT11_BH10ACT11_10730 [soil metagenome]